MTIEDEYYECIKQFGRRAAEAQAVEVRLMRGPTIREVLRSWFKPSNAPTSATGDSGALPDPDSRTTESRVRTPNNETETP